MRERGDTESNAADSKCGLALLPPEMVANVVSFLDGPTTRRAVWRRDCFVSSALWP